MQNNTERKEQDTNESEKIYILSTQRLKELTGFLSTLFPVLGTFYVTVVSTLQYWYCQKAEKFYRIDKSLFYSKNLIYSMTVSFIILILCVGLYVVYNILYRKFSQEDSDNLFILNLFVIFLFVIFIIIKNPELIGNDFILLLGFIISFVFTKITKGKKQNKITMGISCLFKIIILGYSFYLAYLSISVVINTELEKKVDYEIAFPIDSDNNDLLFSSKGENSQFCNVVILHSASQVILMKGKIEKDELILYQAVYSFQDADKYVYVRQIFSKTSPSEELPYELLN